ncbi:ribonuclease P protein subunit p29-like [Convolutriloba macropyga]|uniref:ribonuclease P protein subunit p29-like n=1 Tax=Convolutriloba macropyga TaxID=536237 RepID=UPI003F52463D
MDAVFPEERNFADTMRLYKCEFTGAVLIVSESKCFSYVGINGIVVQDLKKCFRIVTPENRLIIIPKTGSVFIIHHGNFEIRLRGEFLCNKSYERSRSKAKVQNIKRKYNF